MQFIKGTDTREAWDENCLVEKFTQKPLNYIGTGTVSTYLPNCIQLKNKMSKILSEMHKKL